MSKSTLRNIVISLILISCSLAAYGLMVYQIDKQGRELAVQVDVISKEETQQESRLLLKRTAEETAEERAQLKNYFFLQESDSIDFLNHVEEMAPKVGVTVETSALESITNLADKTKWIQAKFSFSGTQDRVQRFLQIMETFPLVSKVVDLEMTAKSSTEWQANIVMQVRVLTYEE